MSTEKVTSYDIKVALAANQCNSFFMTECKTGPTVYNKYLYKFDGLSIDKSWAHPCIRGYEIKVTRSDFLQDQKYCCYLPYCHEMYFVVPKGMIQKTEIPSEFGLIYYNPETKELRTVKKAIHREIEVSADLLMYVIMNRLDSDRTPFYSSKAEYLDAWLKHRKDNQTLGAMIGTHMASEISELSNRLQELEHREEAVNELKEIDEYLRKQHHKYCYSKHSRVDVMKELLEQPLPEELKRIKNEAQEILQLITDYEEKGRKEQCTSETT